MKRKAEGMQIYVCLHTRVCRSTFILNMQYRYFYAFYMYKSHMYKYITKIANCIHTLICIYF